MLPVKSTSQTILEYHNFFFKSYSSFKLCISNGLILLTGVVPLHGEGLKPMGLRHLDFQRAPWGFTNKTEPGPEGNIVSLGRFSKKGRRCGKLKGCLQLQLRDQLQSPAPISNLGLL